LPCKAFDTVGIDTPHSWAICFIEINFFASFISSWIKYNEFSSIIQLFSLKRTDLIE
jgi:hypothetical protein